MYFLFDWYTFLFADTLPAGLVRELPSADEFQNPSVGETSTSVDDLEELRKQLEALNAD